MSEEKQNKKKKTERSGANIHTHTNVSSMGMRSVGKGGGPMKSCISCCVPLTISEVLESTNLNRTLIKLHFCVIEKLMQNLLQQSQSRCFSMTIRAVIDYRKQKVQQKLWMPSLMLNLYHK